MSHKYIFGLGTGYPTWVSGNLESRYIAGRVLRQQIWLKSDMDTRIVGLRKPASPPLSTHVLLVILNFTLLLTASKVITRNHY